MPGHAGAEASTSAPTGLALATPGGRHAEAAAGAAAAEKASRAFGFPYQTAYDIQIQLMQAVFRAIEGGQIGVFESPTGTGKSLSLICAACTWLTLNAERALHGRLGSHAEGAAGNPRDSDSKEPDWVVKHNLERQQRDLVRQEEELSERIKNARMRLVHRAKAAKRDMNERNKRTRVNAAEDDSGSDSSYLVASYEDELAQSSVDGHASSSNGPEAYLSPAVRALMEKTGSYTDNSRRNLPRPFYSRDGAKDNDVDEEPETRPKVVFASRTHSQITQFIGELKKTRFGQISDMTQVTGGESGSQDAPMRCTSIGSRKQMCIHPGVQRIGAERGIEAMNEKCLDLMKGAGGSRCSYLPPHDETGQMRMLDYRDASFAEVRDIEDLTELGKTMGTCSYFGARGSARQAQIVTVPYNLLLNKSARATLNISLIGSVVIIDEAHNLIDTILSSHSVSLSSSQVADCVAQAEAYLARFATRLKGLNEVNIKKLLKVLRGLADFCTAEADAYTPSPISSRAEESGSFKTLTPTELLRRIGGNVDQVNLMELEGWLRETKIARKMAGYSEKRQAAAKLNSLSEKSLNDVRSASKDRQAFLDDNRKGSATAAMHAVESLLLSLVNRDLDGRVYVHVDRTPRAREAAKVQLKYQLLNPADVFSDIAKEARSVILAGGTMEPFSDFETQLFPGCESKRLTRFSCGHIIPPENLMAAVVCKGIKGTPLEFRYEARGNTAMLDELTSCLINYCNIVPSGIVVFVPSYGFLDTLMARWRETQAITRIEAKKKVFFEPKETVEVDKVLLNYASAVNDPTPGRTGAIMLAVVGAKLSEGINFSDQLARAVVMVGMPFANAASPELAERMRYVRTLPGNRQRGVDAGQELYVNLCMKAVNQSIGRAIRHRNDYAALIFFDARYSRSDIRERLPGWIRDSVKICSGFGHSVAALGGFFRNKKTSSVAGR